MKTFNEAQLEEAKNSLNKLDESIEFLGDFISKSENNLEDAKVQFNSLNEQRNNLAKLIDLFEKKLTETKTEEAKNIETAYKDNISKQDKLNEEIKADMKFKDSLLSDKYKNILEKDINKKREKLDALKAKHVSFDSRQRSMVISKQKVFDLRNKLVSDQKAKVDNLESKVNDNELMAGRGNAIDKIRNKIEGKIYKVDYEYQKNILNNMKSRNVGFAGANFMIIKKKSADLFRKGIHNISSYMNQLDQMFVQNNTQETEMKNTNSFSI